LTSREHQYLLDILIEAEDARSFVRDMTFAAFAADKQVRYAVLHSLAIIGEAAGHVSESSAGEIPDLPGRKMKNLRNFIVHQYEGVNLRVIWEIVADDLPVVIAALDPLFPERTKR
jgi:uncharacterized protein with HEPN domain